MRNKVSKPKTKGDFKKITAKVGRKVIRANVTKITVKSKQLHMPKQSQLDNKSSTDNNIRINEIIRNLNHYNEVSRKVAIDELKKFFISTPNAENFIALVLPRALEVLFDEEKEARTALIDLVACVLTKFPAGALRSVAAVAVTYMCSGLTSLNKAIRKDSMILLTKFANSHLDLLRPYSEKVAEHVLALLPDPALAGALDVSVSVSVSAPFATTGGRQPTRAPTPDLLLMGLTLFSMMLSRVSDSRQANRIVQCGPAHRSLVLRPSSMQSSPRGVSDLGPDFQRTLLALSNLHKGTADISATSSATAELPLSVAIVDNLLLRLLSIWSCLVPSTNATPVAAPALPYLQLIMGIAKATWECKYCTHLPSQTLTRLLREACSTFPLTSQEVMLAAPGSEAERTARGAVDLLNLSLCEVVVAVAVADSSTSKRGSDSDRTFGPHSSPQQVVAVEFVCSYLDGLVSAMERGDKSVLRSSGSADSDSGNTSARVKTLFRTLELMTQQQERERGQERDFGQNEHGDRDCEWLHVIGLIKRLFAAGAVDVTTHMSLLGPAVSCLCRLCFSTTPTHEDRGQCQGQGEERDTALAAALAALPSMLSTWPGEPADVIDRVLAAMTELLRRSGGSAGGGGVCSELISLGDSVLCLFRAPKVRTGPGVSQKIRGSSTSLFDKCSLETRKRLLDVWFRLPFRDCLFATRVLLLAVAESVSVSVSGSGSAVEEAYALRLAFERRTELSDPGAFLALLTEMLSSRLDLQLQLQPQRSLLSPTHLSGAPGRLSRLLSLYTAYHRCLGSASVTSMSPPDWLESGSVSGRDWDRGADKDRDRWLASEVGDHVRWMCARGSVGSLKVAATFLEGLEALFEGKERGGVEEQGEQVSHGEARALRSYALTVGVSAVAETLLSTWLLDLGADSGSTPVPPAECIARVADVLLRVARMGLRRCFSHCGASAGSQSRVLEALLDPVFALLRMSLSLTCSLMSLEGGGDDGEVDQALLRCFDRGWQSVSSSDDRTSSPRELELLKILGMHRLAVGSGAIVGRVLSAFADAKISAANAL